MRTSGKIRLFTSLANTKLNQVGDMILEIVFPNGLTPFIQGILEDSSNKKDLMQLLFEETGKQWHIKYVDGKNSTATVDNSSKSNNSVNDLGINVNIID